MILGKAERSYKSHQKKIHKRKLVEFIIKIRNFYLQNTLLREWKDKTQTERKYLRENYAKRTYVQICK